MKPPLEPELRNLYRRQNYETSTGDRTTKPLPEPELVCKSSPLSKMNVSADRESWPENWIQSGLPGSETSISSPALVQRVGAGTENIHTV